MRHITDLVQSFAAAQVAGARDIAYGVVLLFLAAGTALIAMAFALLAGFWALSTVMSEWQAALLISAIALCVAFLLRLLGQHYIRRRNLLRGLRRLDSNKVASEAKSKSKQEPIVDPATSIMLAALVGIIVGRRLFK